MIIHFALVLSRGLSLSLICLNLSIAEAAIAFAEKGRRSSVKFPAFLAVTHLASASIFFRFSSSIFSASFLIFSTFCESGKPICQYSGGVLVGSNCCRCREDSLIIFSIAAARCSTGRCRTALSKYCRARSACCTCTSAISKGAYTVAAVAVNTMKLLSGFFASDRLFIDERYAIILIRVDLYASQVLCSQSTACQCQPTYIQRSHSITHPAICSAYAPFPLYLKGSSSIFAFLCLCISRMKSCPS